MCPVSHAARRFYICIVLVLFSVSVAAGNPPADRNHARAPSVITDSIYNANHPRLLFDRSELPDLRRKVRDGGHDDAAYAYIRDAVDLICSTMTETQIMERTWWYNFVKFLGTVAFLEEVTDTAVLDMGRRMTLYIADNFDPDDDVYYSPLRARTLTFGYDMFFGDAPPSERAHVRDELKSYIDTMMTVFNYERWLHGPYISNKSAMIGSALGLAAVCLAGEIDPALIEAAIARADTFVGAWREAHLDPDGAYGEGALYAGWSMRHLAYYFWARKRHYDGYDFSCIDAIRNLEKWIAYSILPIGRAAVNNINDTAYRNFPLSRHHTYLDWAQGEWGSALSLWIWERLVGPLYGHESGLLADKTATVLWCQSLSPARPEDLLPKHFLWEHRGLYYFRTGWAEEGSSDDVVFSFHSGKFRGGHAQEDQNNFTLYGYGTAFAVDHGYGTPAKESEAHNMVFIDGAGQHNAGSSIGTDGAISEYILSGFADYVLGDATAAYSTYSEYNRPGYPFPDDDWSWGYDGGNPVHFALRRAIVVHEPPAPPYVIILDEIEKDGQPHRYSWRLHTLEENSVDISGNPIRIHGTGGIMDVHVVNPPFEALEVDCTSFDNENADPNSTVLSLSLTTENPRFALLLLPADETGPLPDVVRENPRWGHTVRIGWDNGIDDVFVLNRSEGLVDCTILDGAAAEYALITDARFVLLRINRGAIVSYLAANVSRLDWNSISYIRIGDGKLGCALSGTTFQIDRTGAIFSLYAPDGGEVYYRNDNIPVLIDNGYLVPDPSSGGADHGDASGFLRLRSYPNPFNACTNIIVTLERKSRVNVTLYDITGRPVRTLCNDVLPRGSNLIRWYGTNRDGQCVSSGVYFVKAASAGFERTTKIVLMK